MLTGRALPLPPRPPPATLLQAQREDECCKKMADKIRAAAGGQDGQKGRATVQEGGSSYQVFRDRKLLYVQFPTGGPRLVLPASLRERAMHDHHLSFYAGHFGLHKTYARLAQRYWWPGMRRDVRGYLNRCTFCMAYTRDTAPARWLSLPIGTPFEVVAMDIFGPLPRTRAGCEYILVLIDHHTRWVELVALAQTTATSVAEALFTRWISRWGVMRALLTDNGPQFVAEVFRRLCSVYGIRKIYASPYNPRGNSVVESYMRTLRSTLILCTTKFEAEWDEVLPAAAFAYRTTPHCTTRFSPYFLVVGQEPVLPLSREWEEPTLSRTGALWLRALWACRREVLEAHKKTLQERAAYFKAAPRALREGMVVLVRLTEAQRQAQGKFAPLYQGPYLVKQVLAHGASARLLDQRTGSEHIVNRLRIKIVEVPLPQAKPAKPPRWLAPRQ